MPHPKAHTDHNVRVQHVQYQGVPRMKKRIGTCSICGGNVMGVRGAWMSVNPPPPDTCSLCGAVRRIDVIEMVPRPRSLKDQAQGVGPGAPGFKWGRALYRRKEKDAG